MVYFRELNSHPSTVFFDTGLLESEGRGLVSTSSSLFDDSIYVRTPSGKPWYKAAVSIVICTFERPESLNETLASLTKQTFKNFEVILLTEKGDLSKLRDTGLRCAGGSIVSFIDDDVYCPPTWLEGVTQSFRTGVVGVSGPTLIPSEFRRNRDVFKFRWAKLLHDKLFLQGKASEPGHLSSSGTPSLASSLEEETSSDYVDYLEACNFSVRKEEAIRVGGFDLQFFQTSEWCEVDLALKLHAVGKLFFSKHAALFHKPSQGGIYQSRIKTKHRWQNFIYFQKKWEGKWIKKSLRTYVYRVWVWIYLWMKNQRMI